MMKRFIYFLIAGMLMISLCACAEQNASGGESLKEKNESQSVSATLTESNGDTFSDASGESDCADNTPSNTAQTNDEPDESSDASTPNEEADAGTDGVLYDENGNVILSDPPTYEEILALHLQDPETYRDPGELQPETKEMIRLEDGQWYQSFVASSYNCRYIIWNEDESEENGWWSSAIGSAENAFLYNVGAMYDDPGGQMPYVERAVAVRGTLAESGDSYAYRLILPDKLIVCLENSAGACWFPETDTLAIPETYAPLFDGMTGEVIVTGIVKQDENSVFYLKNIELFA